MQLQCYLLVGFAGDERREAGDDAVRSTVRIDPLPLTEHTRVTVAAASSPRSQPETNPTSYTCNRPKKASTASNDIILLLPAMP